MTKKLLVTAKYGSLVFSEVACPYNKKAHKEQYDSCCSGIKRQIIDAGKEEMLDAFIFQYEVVVE